MGHCAHGIFLTVEDARRPSMVQSLVTSDFDHASLWREIPFEDDQASIGFDRVREEAYHLLAGRL